MNTQIKNITASLSIQAELMYNRLKHHLLFIALLLTWCFSPLWLHQIDQTAGNIDQSIWLLIILSLISFLLLTALSWWLIQRFWLLAGLPSLSTMVSHFNTLLLWQQLGYYWASFALLLFAAVACLGAICH